MTDLSRKPNKKGTRGVEQAKCWMITVNMTEDPEDHESIRRMRRFNAAAQVPPCSYAIFQPEIAPETGRHHIQAYVEMEKSMTLHAIKKHFGDTVHAEIRVGTQQQAMDYCSKLDSRVPDGEVITYGEPMKANKSGGTAGSRTDWADAWAQLKAGKRPAEVLDQHPHMLPCVRALHHGRTEALAGQSRHRKTKCIVLFGDAGTGKSSTARKLAEASGEWCKISTSGNNLWFDHYDPMRHATVILDEFTGSKCKLSLLNELADESQFFVETKGSTMPWLVKTLIITSNFHPKKWYDFDNPEKHFDITSLMRRIDILYEFRKEDTANGKGSVVPMLHLVAHKGFLNVKMVSSVLPIHLPSIDSDSSIGEDSSQPIPQRLSESTRLPRVTRQNAMAGMDSLLEVIDESEDE